MDLAVSVWLLTHFAVLLMVKGVWKHKWKIGVGVEIVTWVIADVLAFDFGFIFLEKWRRLSETCSISYEFGETNHPCGEGCNNLVFRIAERFFIFSGLASGRGVIRRR